ncbi:MAG: SpoIIE family protein phosphatase [Sphingobacteriaceae bacterium]|nr:SpoIIE family protein phosphatase [Sphingobacteriaceae bacterium]
MEVVEDTVVLAAADCTGHGVPGALVSVVCSNALDRAVKEFKLKEPGKILDKVRALVVETFEASENEVKDGMDISLCCISKKDKNVRVEWAGACNPLWYIQEGELKELTPDKQPVGKSDKVKSFTTHTLDLNKGTMIYLITDGYADQFGGPQGKKFKHKNLKEILKTNSTLPVNEQLQKLEIAFESWKGNLEQVDDVSIIGVRV